MKFIAVFSFLCFNSYLYAQIENVNVNLKFNKRDLQINSIPYKNFHVIDNRIDSVAFFTELTGLYPARVVNFSGGLIRSISELLNIMTKDIVNDEKTLLIDFEQFRIPNKCLLWRRKANKYSPINIRDYIFISAGLYEETQNKRFRKIASIKKMYKTYRDINGTISKIMAELVEIATIFRVKEPYDSEIPKAIKSLISDSSLKINDLDTLEYSIAVLSDSLPKKWTGYAINSKSRGDLVDGFYPTFEDFKNDKIIQYKSQLSYNKSDSVYDLVDFNSNLIRFSPWAIYLNDSLYFRIEKDVYIKVTRKENTFFFYIPMTYPNMYDILSIEEGYGSTYIDSQFENGRVFKSPERILSVEKSIEKRKILLRKGKISPEDFYFRNCFVDLDSGDFLFN